MASEIHGILASGIGLGKTFTRLDWAREQFLTRVGIDPFAGTLNVKISDGPSRTAWDRLKATPGIHIDNPNDGPHDCDARCYRVEIVALDGRAYPAAIVLPEVDGYPEEQIELICAIGLRDALGLGDGDCVRLRIAIS